MIALSEYFEFLLLIMESEDKVGGGGGHVPPLNLAGLPAQVVGRPCINATVLF